MKFILHERQFYVIVGNESCGFAFGLNEKHFFFFNEEEVRTCNGFEQKIYLESRQAVSGNFASCKQT